MRHVRYGSPRGVLRAALAALSGEGLTVLASSPVIETAPLGHARRRYANAVAVVAGERDPAATLAALLGIESAFGRRRRGIPWGARVLDLDLVMWSGGAWASEAGVFDAGLLDAGLFDAGAPFSGPTEAGRCNGGEILPDCVIPHPEFRCRSFVLGPARAIAGNWRDPLTGLRVRHLAARLTKPRPTRN